MTTLTLNDLDWLCTAVKHVSDEHIMPRFGQLVDAQIRVKTSAFDIVTDADEACEAALTALLQNRFPSAVVIGEEAADRDPRLLDALASAELAFLVDPLDGTRNFASGLPLFGVMVAAVVKDQVVAGVIHDPVSGTTALARAGGGAWIQDRAGQRARLQVAAPVPVAEIEGIAGTHFLAAPLKERVTANLSRLRMTNWFRCAAHEYRLASAGHCHILFYNRLMPWDHAAGWLLHREAGGYSAHFDGRPYVPSHTSGGLLYAPDQATWHAVHAALFSE